MKINHEKRRLMGTLRDPFPQLNPLRETVYRMACASMSNSNIQIASCDLNPAAVNQPVTELPSTESTKNAISPAPEISDRPKVTNESGEQGVIRELRRVQDDLKRQRNETKLLTDYVSAVAQEVRQVRSQLLSLSEK
jgi:hypothetical protein